MIRRPAVAGHFYSGTKAGLIHEVQRYIDLTAAKEKAIGVLSPHAGLMYSGAVAGSVYSRIEFPRTFILLGPNHTGIGKPFAMMSRGEWEIPTGTLSIDGDLAGKILGYSDILEEDSFAHAMEHSLEVQLPFMLYYSSDVKIVPITIMKDSLESCKLIGDALAEAVRDTGYTVTIVASSDMTHYEADSIARAKDKKAIDRILSLDAEGLYETVKKDDISMCGVIPAIIMLYAAIKLEAREAILVKYMTSGEVNKDFNQVVGYAGIVVK